jgi:PAS domain S-box-containing protein
MAQRGASFDEELVGLFDLSHDAFCIAGFDGYLRRANPAFARSLGYTLEELLARAFMENVYPDDVESVEAVLAELAAGKDIIGFECREVCADGSVRWFEWSTSSRPEATPMPAVETIPSLAPKTPARSQFSFDDTEPACGSAGWAAVDMLATLDIDTGNRQPT